MLFFTIKTPHKLILNRLTQENQSGAIVNYTYDVNNNLTSITNPNNKITNYEYDTLNRLTTIKQNNETIINNNYTGIENTSTNYGNTKTITKTYDNLNRINSLNNGIKTYNYTYDDVNNITSDNNKNYTYDDIYRIKQTTDTNTTTLLESFDYDNLGNRQTSYNQATGSGANYDYATNNLNQYTTLSGSILSYQLQEIVTQTTGSGTDTGSCTNTGSGTTGSGTTESGSGTIETGSGTTTGSGETNTGTTIITYTGSYVTTNENITYIYDNNGNLKQDNKYKYYYDYKNRLVKATNLSDETVVEFAYDVLNRRFLLRQGFEGQAPKTTKTFIYSNENILQETTTDNITNTTKTRDYINGLGTDELVAFEENSQRYYYHKDHLGSIVGLTNNNGDTILEYDYDIFGKSKVISGDANFENTRLYTGREYDTELGLYYNRARYYNPELARFISRDPIDIKDDVNLYAYVGNNGVMFVDRSGKEKALLMIVDIFNQYGSIYEVVGKSTFIPEDYDPGLNLSFGYTILSAGKANLKVRSDLLELSDNGYISTSAGKIHLSEFGNILYGYLGEKSGFSYEHIENAAYSATYNLKYGNGTDEERIEATLGNEISDRVLYKEGYNLSQKQEKITKDDLLNLYDKITEARKLEKYYKSTGISF